MKPNRNPLRKDFQLPLKRSANALPRELNWKNESRYLNGPILEKPRYSMNRKDTIAMESVR